MTCQSFSGSYPWYIPNIQQKSIYFSPSLSRIIFNTGVKEDWLHQKKWKETHPKVVSHHSTVESTKNSPFLYCIFFIFQTPSGSPDPLLSEMRYQDTEWYMLVLHTKSRSFHLYKIKIQLDFCLCTNAKMYFCSFIFSLLLDFLLLQYAPCHTWIWFYK